MMILHVQVGGRLWEMQEPINFWANIPFKRGSVIPFVRI